jgi:23S rRNA pseudouridine1911/1915/1917 synthase
MTSSDIPPVTGLEPGSDDDLDLELISSAIPDSANTELPAELHHNVKAGNVGERLDKVVSSLRPDLSRAHIQRLIEEGKCTVNEKPSKPGYKLRNGDDIHLIVPPPEPLAHLSPEPIKLDIVYEDADIMVINKPAGMVVHPAPGHYSGTLVNALLYHIPDLNINGNIRPGIAHRLDKDTSGLLVVAKSDKALGSLISQMKEHTTLKEYLALVDGNMQPPAGIIDAPIGRDPSARKQMAVVPNGRPARTEYKVLKYLEEHSLVQVRLHTGRTHQIRVHFSYMGYPVTGDTVYGKRKPTLPLKRQFLHAARLGIKLPSGGEYREFEAPLPPELEKALEKAQNIS